MLDFEGENYRNKQRSGALAGWIEPPRRERKQLTYTPKETRPVDVKAKV
jgi:hypothetical protein